MVASILPADPPSPDPRGQKVKILLFQNMVMLHIKLNGITKSSIMVENIFPADTLGVKRLEQNSTFSEQCHVAYQIRGNQECSKMVANDLPADQPPL